MASGRQVPGASAVAHLIGRRSAAVSGPAEPKGSAVVDWAFYRDGVRDTSVASYAEAVRRAAEGVGFVWIGLHEPNVEELAGIAAEFGLHPLAVEDAVTAHQRPKLDQYDDSLFLVLKTVAYVEHSQVTATSDIVTTGEVMVFVGRDFVVTVRHGDHGALRKLRHDLEADPKRLSHGPSAVLHAVADHVVDNYLVVAGELQDDIDEMESAVFSPRGADTGQVYQLKREVLQFKRAITPLTTPMRTLAERPLDLVNPKVREYLRDVEDHLTKASEMANGYDELLTSVLQASLAQLSVAQNSDMRKISAWVAIFAVPTMIAGIYGMNFDHMPELRWTYGYPAVIAVILVLCFVLYRGFKRNGWL
jgi:magnesium transporter